MVWGLFCRAEEVPLPARNASSANQKSVHLDQLWPFPDPLVVTVGFYGSEAVPKTVLIRSETVRGPVFGRVAEK